MGISERVGLVASVAKVALGCGLWKLPRQARSGDAPAAGLRTHTGLSCTTATSSSAAAALWGHQENPRTERAAGPTRRLMKVKAGTLVIILVGHVPLTAEQATQALCERRGEL